MLPISTFQRCGSHSAAGGPNAGGGCLGTPSLGELLWLRGGQPERPIWDQMQARFDRPVPPRPSPMGRANYGNTNTQPHLRFPGSSPECNSQHLFQLGCQCRQSPKKKLILNSHLPLRQLPLPRARPPPLLHPWGVREPGTLAFGLWCHSFVHTFLPWCVPSCTAEPELCPWMCVEPGIWCSFAQGVGNLAVH